MEQETNNFNFVPICGQSEERNREYLANFSPEKYWKSLVVRNSPIIFDIGAHRGESVRFFKEIFPDSIVYSFEPDPDNFSELEALVHSCSWGGGNVYPSRWVLVKKKVSSFSIDRTSLIWAV